MSLAGNEGRHDCSKAILEVSKELQWYDCGIGNTSVCNSIGWKFFGVDDGKHLPRGRRLGHLALSAVGRSGAYEGVRKATYLVSRLRNDEVKLERNAWSELNLR